MRKTSKQKKEIRFAWKAGMSYFKSEDPAAIGSELERLRLKNGGELPPERVVDAASDPHSPLHAVVFEVDDEKAAYIHRLDRAKLLLRCIIKIEVVGGKEYSLRIAEPVARKGDTAPRWMSTDNAMQDPEFREDILKRALREALAFRRKYAELSELSVVFASIDRTVQGLQRSRKAS
jgi:hypothetical protein